MSILEDMEGAFMDAPCMEHLGDTIGYKAVGSTRFVPMHAYVDYGDAARSIDGGQIIDQDISLETLKSDIPARPSSASRITLSKLPGKTFKPVNVRSDSSGNYWNFEVVLVNA